MERMLAARRTLDLKFKRVPTNKSVDACHNKQERFKHDSRNCLSMAGPAREAGPLIAPWAQGFCESTKRRAIMEQSLAFVVSIIRQIWALSVPDPRANGCVGELAFFVHRSANIDLRLTTFDFAPVYHTAISFILECSQKNAHKSHEVLLVQPHSDHRPRLLLLLCPVRRRTSSWRRTSGESSL
jgi:hypothetical protein